MKTAGQLEREIAEALAGEHYYFVVDRRGGHRTIYGPFDTLKDAEYAGYFAKPVADRDAHAAKGKLNIYFMTGVQRYDGNEIRSLGDYPTEWGIKSAKLRQGSPPMHSSWRAFGKESREWMRDKDYGFR